MQTTTNKENISVPPYVDFLGKFSRPEELKFLTHGFDIDGDFLSCVQRCRCELACYKGRIPESLYETIFGFVYGPQWVDYKGDIHTESCADDTIIEWCLNHSGKHPMSDPKGKFSRTFECFKNSIRIYSMTFDEYIEELEHINRFPNITLTQESLSRLDTYIDARHFRTTIEKILQDINDSRFVVKCNEVNISLKRNTYYDGVVKKDQVIIEHRHSFPKRSFDDVLDHFNRGGGFLHSITTYVEGYYELEIEATWHGCPIRWNLSKTKALRNLHSNNIDNVTGFRYILNIYHKD